MTKKIHYGIFAKDKGDEHFTVKPACGAKSRNYASLWGTSHKYSDINCKTCLKIMEKIKLEGEGSPL